MNDVPRELSHYMKNDICLPGRTTPRVAAAMVRWRASLQNEKAKNDQRTPAAAVVWKLTFPSSSTVSTTIDALITLDAFHCPFKNIF